MTAGPEIQRMSIIKRVELIWDHFAKFHNKWVEEINGMRFIKILNWMTDLKTFDEGIEIFFYILNSAYLRGRNKYVLDELSLDKNLKVKRLYKVSDDIGKHGMLDIVFLRDFLSTLSSCILDLLDFKGDFIIDFAYGKCAQCKKLNTSRTWCQTCDPELISEGWTSGNNGVDYCIKNFQRKATSFRDIIEWIPFNSLKNIKKVGKGGVGTIFSVTWLDGAPEIQGSVLIYYMRTRNKSCIIALKSLHDSNILIFLQEFKNHMECKLKGNLHEFLEHNFRILTWQDKLKQLVFISYDLAKIHKANYIHRDLHSGNILLNKNLDDEIYSYITDLGFSRKTDWKDLENSDLFGVLPCIAPEILKTNQYTQAAVIYGFGVILWEMATGKRPFDNISRDILYFNKICDGLQLEFPFETPDCYVTMAKKYFEINEKFLYSDKINKQSEIINIGNSHEINKQSETNLSQFSNFTNFANENCETIKNS
ncbi:kinase-like domain-containing protein [Gigaspora rosea]|uniref:Kinase-like domain-containing protein n=1 Tax=Gigaspora rosea TaxID=44941 RepID=A0A397UUN4_9GLOM|nr:kinase-like domain-containing protein [Gigaspora rosea]